MLRTLKRWFSTEETKLLSKELDDLKEKFATFGHRLEGFDLRIERHMNKLRMQEVRSQTRGRDEFELSEEEIAILQDIRRRGGDTPIPGRDPFN